MSGIFLVRTDDPAFASPALSEARAQFALHRFAAPTEITWPGWHLLFSPHILGGPDSLLRRGEDFLCVAGTMTFDGLMGRAALDALFDAFDGRTIDWSRIGGQFIIVLKKGGQCTIFTDYFATFQLFHDAEERVFSTSFLSTLKALPTVQFDTQGLYEFVFNTVALGNDTIFSGIRLLGPERLLQLGEHDVSSVPLSKPLPETFDALPLPDRIAWHKEKLSRLVRGYVGQFGDNVYCPLSGGLDSRLVLGALRSEGCSPHVYVYGTATNPDVTVALDVGRAEGFEVVWDDKVDGIAFTPEDFPERVERNFHGYDALPNFGELFDIGGNGLARDKRHLGGALAVSGGAGEIYRNFFFLPDRPVSAMTVARAFFARFTRRDATALFDGNRFLETIEGKILAAVGRAGSSGKLPRAVAEQVYPRIRCRSLFGKEISVEGRHGAYMMPFLDQHLVAAATSLPLNLKNAGRFEAMLLNAIDPSLASRMSAYGHDFTGPPSRHHLFSEWATRIRPARLRAASYALQRRRGPVDDGLGGLQTPDYLARVIDLDYPAMRKYFNVDDIQDVGIMRRIACVEYLAQHLGSRLRH